MLRRHRRRAMRMAAILHPVERRMTERPAVQKRTLHNRLSRRIRVSRTSPRIQPNRPNRLYRLNQRNCLNRPNLQVQSNMRNRRRPAKIILPCQVRQSHTSRSTNVTMATSSPRRRIAGAPSIRPRTKRGGTPQARTTRVRPRSHHGRPGKRRSRLKAATTTR